LIGIGLFTVGANAQSTNTAPGSPGQRFRAVPIEPGGPSYVDGEILIKFRADANDSQIADVVRRASVNSARHIQTPAMRDRGDNGITRATTALPVPQALQALLNHPALEYAQPNWIYRHQEGATTPSTFDDTYFQNGALWGMYDSSHTLTVNQYGSGAVGAWIAGFTGNNQVCVGVIDEGIDFNHPDLKDNIWTNRAEIPDDTTDNDDNGYLNDIHGWNAIDDNNVIYFPGYDNHGTHVAGTIGATGANGFGVSGINWNVSIISGKFIGPDGQGTTADAIQAIDYMTKLKDMWNQNHTKGANIVALNNSWGGGGYDPLLLEAIKRAANEAILFVAAAGNGNFMGRAVNTDRTPFYPSCYDTSKVELSYDSVISVTAIDASGAKASWANYGKITVDLGAPGVDIVSTLPGGSYGRYDGTSMAAPHVTGAIALYASTHPGAIAAVIRNALLDSTMPTPSLSSVTATGGRLDIPRFLNNPVGPVLPGSSPTAPSLVKATADSSSQITLEWTDNSNNETGFRIVRAGVSSPWSAIVSAGTSSARTFLDQGLSASTTYTYEIYAYNAHGEVAASGTVSAITPALPDPAGTAAYVAKDTTTKGNWIDKYGAQGYHVILDGTPTTDIPNPENPRYPVNLTVTRNGAGIWGWAFPFSTSDTDVRDLQSTMIPGARGSGCWYSAGYFTVDLNFSDATVHRVALYCLDWENAGRRQTIDIIDPANNTVLNSQSVSSFYGGQYLIWDISGHVIIRFTCTGGVNAVLSGLFFDLPTDAPPTVSITSPANNSTVSGTMPITATASDDRGVTQVEFFANGNSIGIDYSGADGWSVTWNTGSVGDGSCTLTAKATDTAGQSTRSTGITVTVRNSAPTILHCGDLDGISKTVGSKWLATVTVTIHDGNHVPVSGATVKGAWSNGYSGTVTGTTGAAGTVNFSTGNMSTRTSGVTFTINSVSLAGYTYIATANHDPESDSDGTTITTKR
jgi:subtilisin family serine protease